MNFTSFVTQLISELCCFSHDASSNILCFDIFISLKISSLSWFSIVILIFLILFVIFVITCFFTFLAMRICFFFHDFTFSILLSWESINFLSEVLLISALTQILLILIIILSPALSVLVMIIFLCFFFFSLLSRSSESNF